MSYHSCWVGNLGEDVNEQILNEIFEKFGKIMSISINQKKENKKFAFINFSTKEEAVTASINNNGYELKGNFILTNYKAPKIFQTKEFETKEIEKKEETKEIDKTPQFIEKKHKSSPDKKNDPPKDDDEILTTKCYFAEKLNENDEKYYKSAGIFATRTENDKIFCLFGLEKKFETKKYSLSILGGKREFPGTLNPDKDSIECASREFYEESGMILDQEEIYQKIMKTKKVLWVHYGKYALYFLENYIKEDIIDNFLKEGDKSEIKELFWVPLDDLKNVMKDNITTLKIGERELEMSVYCKKMVRDILKFYKF